MKITTKIEASLYKSIFKQSYYEFFKVAFGVLHPDEELDDNWHIKYLCDILQQQAERIAKSEPRVRDLIINMPFRSSKSMICTIIFIAWVWGALKASMKFITVSYSSALALEHAQRSRDLIDSQFYQSVFGDVVKWKAGEEGKGHYYNTRGGFRKSVGVGGQITGSGGDFLILDDPINPKKAASEVERKNGTDFYRNTLYSRLNRPEIGMRVIVMQRLHEEDLSGYLIDISPEKYFHICLPGEITQKAIIRPESLRQFYIDGLFWNTRFSRKVLSDFEAILGSKEYAGQIQQLPSPEEGDLVKRDWFDIVEPESVTIDLQINPINFYIDTAETEKEANDPSGLLAGFEKDGFVYIVKVAEKRLAFFDLCKQIPEFVYENKYNFYSKIKVEPKSSGKSVVDQLARTTGLNISEGIPPKDDKYTRLSAHTPKLESRRVKLIRGNWNKEFLDQICDFPNAKHDEFVDVLVMALDDMLDNDDGIILGFL